MENLYPLLASKLGVEIGEVFEIKGYSQHEFKILLDGLYYRVNGDSNWYKIPKIESLLIAGEAEIVKKPFAPKYGESYWFIAPNREIVRAPFIACAFDLYFFSHSNMYRTEDEATKNIDKHMKEFFKIKEAMK